MYCGDVSTAFLRGSSEEAQRNLFVEGTPELREHMHLKPGQVLKLRKATYGLMNAPRRWYERVEADLTRMGWRKCRQDSCVYMLNDSRGALVATVAFHVDDFLVAGQGPLFERKFQELKNAHKWGPWDKDQFVFCGIHVSRTKRYGFKLEQSDKVLAIEEIPLSNLRKRDLAAPATPSEHSRYRGVVGSLHYVAAHTRPDLAAAASILQGVASRPLVEHLIEANKELRLAQEHDEVAIFIEPISSGRMLLTVFTDASWANRYDGSSQGGFLIVAHDAAMLDGKTVVTNPMDWSSRKLHRVARSSLSAGLQSNTNGLDSLAFALLMFTDMSTTCKAGERSLTGIAADVESKRHAGAVVMDHKGLYDIYSGKRLQLEEKRSQVEAQSNLESISTHWGH